MTLAYANHQVHRGNGKTAEVTSAGTVFDAGDDFDDLKALGAVREPTEDEVSLHGLKSVGKKKAAKDALDHDDNGKKGGAKAPVPVEPAVEPAPAADATENLLT